MAIDGSAFNSDDLRATSVACHGCRIMGSSEAPISSHKSSTSRSFSATGRLLSSLRSMLIRAPPQGTLRYHACSTAMTSGQLYRSLSPGESSLFVRANKSSGRLFLIRLEPTKMLCHTEDGDCRQSRRGSRLDIPAAGSELKGSKDRTGRFTVP